MISDMMDLIAWICIAVGCLAIVGIIGCLIWWAVTA